MKLENVKKSGFFFKCNKQSSVRKKKDETGEKLTPSLPPSITLANASGKRRDISVTFQDFFETLQVGLGEFIESVKDVKVVINSFFFFIHNTINYRCTLITNYMK